MHICFLTHEYPKPGFSHGGIGTFIQTIGKALVKENHRVSVIGINVYNNEDEKVIDEGVIVYRLKSQKVKGLTWLINSKKIENKIKNLNKKIPINILESTELGLAFLKKEKTIKYLIRLHGGHHFFAEAEKRGVNFWKGFQEKRSFKKADGFIAVSNYVKQHTQKYLSYNEKPIRLINCPISFEKFLPSNSTVVKKESIVFAGTVCEKKGIKELITSLKFIDKKYKKVHLNVYGRDWTFPDGGSYVEYLKNHFDKRDLDKVTFYGPVSHSDLPKIYAAANVCVFPSHMETQGLVAPEAMAMEKVVIFTNLGPGPETIVPFKTGLLCNPLDPKDIAEQITWVFENTIKAEKIGEQARVEAIKKFNPEKILAENILFYKEFTL